MAVARNQSEQASGRLGAAAPTHDGARRGRARRPLLNGRERGRCESTHVRRDANGSSREQLEETARERVVECERANPIGAGWRAADPNPTQIHSLPSPLTGAAGACPGLSPCRSPRPVSLLRGSGGLCAAKSLRPDPEASIELWRCRLKSPRRKECAQSLSSVPSLRPTHLLSATR